MVKKDPPANLKAKIDKTDHALLNFFDKIEQLDKNSSNKKTFDAIKNDLYDRWVELKKELQKNRQKDKTEITKLNKQVEELKKTNETVISDNYLLEYKKKDLLLLADNLEEAYEEISAKNQELQEQKRQLSEQAEKIQKANEEITEKNQELEQQKEAIMDQADYLHEANETITSMHEEVQKQKNEILRKNKELISLNNEKNNLISIVAHDLKSPLNQIKGLVSLIKITAKDLDDETARYVETIEKSTTRLNELIAKILDVEAIEAKKLNINTQKTDLSQLLKQCIQRFEITAKNKSIQINTKIKDDLFASVDPAFTNQVYENLISNAIKFSPKYTSIDIELQDKDGHALLEVKDNGPGLSETDMKKLFGKYQKLSAKPTGDETSTGLGLSIVKKYVDAMQGKIWCESEQGKGASFFVSFKMIK